MKPTPEPYTLTRPLYLPRPFSGGAVAMRCTECEKHYHLGPDHGKAFLQGIWPHRCPRCGKLQVNVTHRAIAEYLGLPSWEDRP